MSLPEQPMHDLIKAGYAHAAQAFSALVHQPVSFVVTSCAILKAGGVNAISYPSDDATLVLTDIIGEKGGRSYLLLSELECNALQDLCIPATDPARQRADLQEALLMEIDNILSAAMITKFSEALGIRIFGGIPQLISLPAEALRESIEADFAREEEDYCLVTSARFTLETTMAVQPQFFWRLSPGFLRHVEKYIQLSQ